MPTPIERAVFQALRDVHGMRIVHAVALMQAKEAVAASAGQEPETFGQPKCGVRRPAHNAVARIPDGQDCPSYQPTSPRLYLAGAFGRLALSSSCDVNSMNR